MSAYTVQLPQGLYHYLKTVASKKGQPLEQLVKENLQESFRPSLDDIPEQYHADLEPLIWMDDDELWEVARYRRPTKRTEHHHDLLRANANDKLTPAQQTQLALFRDESDRLLVRTSYAYLLLKQRGHDIPNPYDPKVIEEIGSLPESSGKYDLLHFA